MIFQTGVVGHLPISNSKGDYASLVDSCEKVSSGTPLFVRSINTTWPLQGSSLMIRMNRPSLFYRDCHVRVLMVGSTRQ